jgi:hypothetical protein
LRLQVSKREAEDAAALDGMKLDESTLDDAERKRLAGVSIVFLHANTMFR